MDIVIIDHQETLARLIPTDRLTVRFFDDPVAAYLFIETSRPAIVFVSFELLKDDAFRYIEYLYRLIPDSPIILTAGQLEDDKILDCLASGARGYLEINEAEKFIVKLIGVVLNGEAWVSRRLVAKLLRRLHNSRRESLNAG
ncbi:MAG: DNA-binding response regulator [Methylomicrobium sp.]|jgi:Response regulator containing a CheY-like receiver domain and an HTH DNA-binding domain